jgi:hypothetical protein
MKKLILTCLIIACLTDICCSRIRERNINLTINRLNQMGFDRNYWLTDTLGCNAQKKTQNAKIIEKKGVLDNLSKDEIIKVLGKPFEIEINKVNTNFFYCIDGSLMCDNLKFRNILLTSGNSYIVFTFDKKDKLVQIITNIP